MTNLAQRHYITLGAVADFSDELIDFCYNRQSQCDPVQTSHYFDCLQSIANARSSESLQIKASMLESEGVVGQKVGILAMFWHLLTSHRKSKKLTTSWM